MSNTVIKVEGVSKQYRLGQISTGSLAHDINRWWHTLRGRPDPYLQIGEVNDRTVSGSSEYVWALRDISFEVKQGEVLGIIGRNGAGKSTLLKILSRTTLPTTGSIKAKGRIASLLEVGTGFHPELTGRENIFLNGAILGMTKREITRKFDEIVDFSGVEKYIDTPVKRYSSGMYVRLAFAVAAHLEPEILIVDEVLAVGDAEFQKKCLGKMKDVSVNEGRTVLFVSHNIAAIRGFCSRSIVLDKGAMLFNGGVLEGVTCYQSQNVAQTGFCHRGELEQAPGNSNIRILEFNVYPLDGEVISISSGISFELLFFNCKSKNNLATSFELRTIDEIIVFHRGTWICEDLNGEEKQYRVKGTIGPNVLNAGIYKFNLVFGASLNILLFAISDFVQFEVLNESQAGNNLLLPGIISPDIKYEIST